MSRLWLCIVFFLLGCGNLEYIKLEQVNSEWQEITDVEPSISPQATGASQSETPPLAPQLDKTGEPEISLDFSGSMEHKTLLAGDSVHLDIIGGEIWVFPGLTSFGKWVSTLDFMPTRLNPNVPISHQHILVPARDRRNEMAVTLGLNMLSPNIGGNSWVPFGAFFIRQHNQEDTRRFRGIIAGVTNYIDYSDSTWNEHGIEMFVHWENVTIPIAQGEIVEGRNAQYMEVEWGYLLGGIGLGWRSKTHNFWASQYSERNDFDNDLRIQLSYEPGSFYTQASSASSDIILPPDTDIHQLHLRFRFDTITRNLLEMPHSGFSCGSDIVIGRKQKWSDHQFPENFIFERENTRDYLKITGYAVAAFGIPWVSELHRLIASVHAGWVPSDNWDRFTGLRFGGGPPKSEADDLSRPVFPGAAFQQFIAERYVIASLEYRYELLDFFYIHARGTWVWGDFGFLKEGHHTLQDRATAFSVAISTGFLWKTLLYAEYTIDNGFLRQGPSGYSLLLTLSKQL